MLTIVMTDVSSNKIHSLRFPDSDNNAYLTFISFIIATIATFTPKIDGMSRLEIDSKWEGIMPVEWL